MPAAAATSTLFEPERQRSAPPWRPLVADLVKRSGVVSHRARPRVAVPVGIAAGGTAGITPIQPNE